MHWIWIRILNFDPLWNWILGYVGYVINFERKFKKKLQIKIIFLKIYVFLNNKKLLSSVEIFLVKWVSEWWNCLQSCTFCSNLWFILYLPVWTRIHNTDCGKVLTLSASCSCLTWSSRPASPWPPGPGTAPWTPQTGPLLPAPTAVIEQAGY